MPRSANQKKKLFILSQIFEKETDASSPLTLRQLIDKLALCGIKAERKSIYQDIEALRELGLDIVTVKAKNTGYYLASRRFELPELKLLVDSVCASKFVTQKKSEELVKKLASFGSPSEQKSLRREVYVSNRTKTSNEKIYYAVDALHEAMNRDLSVSFVYFSWNEKKEQVLRNGGNPYHVSPWSLVWDDNNYYLVGVDESKNEVRHYRVDKMKSVSILDTKRTGKERFEKYDLGAYTDGMFGMFGGRRETVTLSCKNSLANVIIDRFGKELPFFDDGDRFRVTVKVVASPMFFGWVLSFGGDVKILSPQSAVEKLKELKNA